MVGTASATSSSTDILVLVFHDHTSLRSPLIWTWLVPSCGKWTVTSLPHSFTMALMCAPALPIRALCCLNGMSMLLSMILACKHKNSHNVTRMKQWISSTIPPLFKRFFLANQAETERDDYPLNQK